MLKNKLLLLLLLMMGSYAVLATQYKVSGYAYNAQGKPLDLVSVALLNPEDSTFVHFGTSDPNGLFTISNVNEGTYLCQVALMGYYTQYKSVTLNPGASGDLGVFALEVNDRDQELGEVIISGEKVPLRINGDTLEYNAGSYKVKSDAMVEDLLKKMPGIEVDRSGNIKSMGKNVEKVLVNGKEFFGDDPQVASKNLPADAVDKIQAYASKNESSLFSGIDDGSRAQTLNLILKEGRNVGYFGEVKIGGAYPKQYEGSVKAFKFRKSSQLAALGMVNNINKFGFTFNDYVNMTGGISSLLQGGNTLNLDDMPIDIGRPIEGTLDNGAAALNYSLEPNSNKRLRVNYWGSGVVKNLQSQSNSINYLPSSSFTQYDTSLRNSDAWNNKLVLNWRQKLDTMHMYTANAYLKYDFNNAKGNNFTHSYTNNQLQNTLYRLLSSNAQKVGVGAGLNWVSKLSKKWPVFKMDLSGNYSNNNDGSRWNNRTTYQPSITEFVEAQQLRFQETTYALNARLAIVKNLGKNYFLEPFLKGDINNQLYSRRQLDYEAILPPVDSLSPQLRRNAYTTQGGLTMSANNTKLQWSVSMALQQMGLNTKLNNEAQLKQSYVHVLPSANFRAQLKNNTYINLDYNTRIDAPSAAYLLPVIDYSNPLNLTRGNLGLIPTYNHTLSLNYSTMKLFNNESFMVSGILNYSKNSIGSSITVGNNLVQNTTVVNTPQAIMGQGSIHYARDVKPIGLNVSIKLSERYNSGVNYVNNIENRNNAFTHGLDLEFRNLRSDNLDVRFGGKVDWTDVKYSLNKELNNTYVNYSSFLQLEGRWWSKWNLSFTADLTHYTARSFDQPITIPLLKAEVTRYFLPNNRVSVSLKMFDILDRNKAVYRNSSLNNLQETKYNTIGRYLMLTFGFKLNKTGDKAKIPGGLD